MSSPARTLLRPSHGIPALAATRAAYATASPSWAAAIELRQRPLPSYSAAVPILYLSTTAHTLRNPRLPSRTRRGLTTLQERNNTPAGNDPPDVWFTAHPPVLSPDQNRPPDDRKVKLGKTLRILQERLPTLLQSPLPQEVLSPHITLHLFPSTHPHLPTVTGRVAYIAALWSSPIAWNRVPLVGNVRLEILSERMVDSPVVPMPHCSSSSLPGGSRPDGACGEQLIVRWRTVGGGGSKILGKGGGWLSLLGNGNGKKAKGKGGKRGVIVEGKDDDGGGDSDGKAQGGETAGRREVAQGKEEQSADGGDTEVKAPVGMAQPARSTNKEFTGLFIFDFDSEGRILSHTIEHVQEGGQWEKGVGAKVVGLTDWLLGGIKGGDAPCPAFARERFRKGGS